MAWTVHVTADVEVPRVPNFLKMTNGGTLPISALCEEELRRIGEQWIENLVRRAEEQAGQDPD